MVVALDTSGDWLYISAVVVFRRPSIRIPGHVARVRRQSRDAVIADALSFIRENGYAVCLLADVRRKARALAVGSREKRSAWEKALKGELRRIADHLRSRGFVAPDRIFADREFEPFLRIVGRAFGTPNVSSGKNEYVALADAVAYANLKRRKLVRSYGISELR